MEATTLTQYDALVGVTMKSVAKNADNDEMTFEAEDGRKWKFYHYQDCCESVGIEDINGELEHLVGSPILVAEELVNCDSGGSYDDSTTWTFYRFATAKGWVVVRWCGSSNGYYSESVDFTEVKD